MAQLLDDGEGGYLLEDDLGAVYDLLEDEYGNPAIQYDDGEMLHLDPDLIQQGIDLVDQGEIAEFADGEDYEGYEDNGEAAEAAWLGFLERQMQALDKSLNRRLTNTEVAKLFEAAQESNVPNPDLKQLHRELFPGRDSMKDDAAKKAVIEEVAQDSFDRDAEREAETPGTAGWESETESDDDAEDS